MSSLGICKCIFIIRILQLNGICLPVSSANVVVIDADECVHVQCGHIGLFMCAKTED